MNSVVIERLELENELRKALENKEFEIYYQPQYDLKTSKVTGLEALLRWNHEELGSISPGKFIPIAEETGLIVPLGTWVIQKACQDNAQWQSLGYDTFKVAVNVSVVQIMKSDLFSIVSHALKQSGLDPQWLELEVTESILMNDMKVIEKQLFPLKKLGVTIAIDDFGTGYSSISYLKKLPIDCLKIDRSFVTDIDNQSKSSHKAKSLIETCLYLAKNLNLKLVAEGIEHQEQFAFLREIGCHLGQGFLFNKPMPSHEITSLIAKIPFNGPECHEKAGV